MAPSFAIPLPLAAILCLLHLFQVLWDLKSISWRNDPRIHVLHQKNSGQAHARNRAFQESHGEYILYVDSDDFIARNHVEVLMSAAMQYDADIVQCFMKKFKGKNPSSEEKNSIV